MFAAGAATSLTDYGVLGIVLSIAFGAIGWLAHTFIKRESDRSDRLEGELRDQNKQMMSVLTDKAIPALMESTQAVKESTDLQRDVHDLLQRLLENQRHDHQ